MAARAFRVIAALVLTVACFRVDQAAWLGTPQALAPGVDLFRTSDISLVNPQGPIAVYLLRLDLDRVQIESALATDEIMGAESVDLLASRRQAIAAVNGGFFNLKNGEPLGLLKVAGELVSDNILTRGAVAVQTRPGARQQLDFDQVAVKVEAHFRMGAQPATAAIDGVDTIRERGKLMLFTPMYHADTDTAANGTEWVLTGNPLKVTDLRRDLGKTPIPRDGVVLSYGGLEPPSPLDWLALGSEVTLVRNWKILNGTPPERFETARDIINGAGLLKRNGTSLSNWHETEGVVLKTFVEVRHPRTLMGVDRRGFLWLVAIDGRQPGYSVGMTFTELVALCDRLELSDALNLDGGGSTTMVAGGAIVNKPSDGAPRPVSDAVLVRGRD